MTRRAKIEHISGFTVLLVDDNPDYLQATRLLLEREGHHVLTATNGAEALAMLPRQHIDLLLLDYFMPGMTGEQVVDELRKSDPFIQVILQTGYASEQPPRELLQRLNIQGYYDKTEGPEQLLLWTTVGLKAAATAQSLLKSRRLVSLAADSTAKLQRAAAPTDAVHEALVQMSRVIEQFVESPLPSVFVATVDGSADLQVRAGTGPFNAEGRVLDVAGAEVLDRLERALHGGEVYVSGSTVLPLRVGISALGAVYIDRSINDAAVLDVLRVIAHNASTSIYNLRLADVAAVDVVTGAQLHSAFEQSLVREVRAAFRAGTGVALALIEVDGVAEKRSSGARRNAERDVLRAAAGLGRVVRAEDVIGRYEADGFGVILRNAAFEGPARMADRLADALHAELHASGVPPLALSVGYAAAPPHDFVRDELQRSKPAAYFSAVAELMKATAVAALGEAHAMGGNVVRAGAAVNWPRL